MNQSKYKEPKRSRNDINEDYMVGEFRRNKAAKGKRRKQTLHDKRKGGTKRFI